MAYKTMDDIDKEKHKESRDKMKKEVIEDVNEIIGGIFGKPKKNKKNIIDKIFGVLKIIGIIVLIMIVINLVLGNVWLLKFFLKSLFGIG